MVNKSRIKIVKIKNPSVKKQKKKKKKSDSNDKSKILINLTKVLININKKIQKLEDNLSKSSSEKMSNSISTFIPYSESEYISKKEKKKEKKKSKISQKPKESHVPFSWIRKEPSIKVNPIQKKAGHIIFESVEE